MESLIPFRNERGVRAELLNVFLNLIIESGDQRGDQHDHTDPENYAKHRQSAAQLMGPQGVHGLSQIFTVCLGHYSS